jgi:DNA polymerase-3 subunit gamma/tau
LKTKFRFIDVFNEILSKGFDAHHFVSGLASHFRFIFSKTPATLSLLEVGEQAQKCMAYKHKKCSQDFL